jgi:hypothetical protein
MICLRDIVIRSLSVGSMHSVRICLDVYRDPVAVLTGCARIISTAIRYAFFLSDSHWGCGEAGSRFLA